MSKVIDKIKPYVKRGLIFSIPEERTFLYRNLYKFAKGMEGKTILDMGAGDRRYEHLFKEKNNYEACDIADSFHPEFKQDIVATVYDIPRKDKYFDIVLLLQVLEHLEYPEKGLTELHRVLKDDGKLFLSVPQAAGDHFEPYHFFNYTQYGLKSILERTGFEIVEHYRLAGMFKYVANRMSKLGRVPLNKARKSKNIISLFFASIFFVIFNWSAYILSLFDFIDDKKAYCIGHIVIAQKKKN